MTHGELVAAVCEAVWEFRKTGGTDETTLNKTIDEIMRRYDEENGVVRKESHE